MKVFALFVLLVLLKGSYSYVHFSQTGQNCSVELAEKAALGQV